MKTLDTYKGCMVGGAVGDALGYAVEFLRLKDIQKKYGPGGITEYELNHGVAQISDDTQMTLFTAVALLIGQTRSMLRGIGGYYPDYAKFAYRDWLTTQHAQYSEERASSGITWLMNIPELYAARAPGNTCISAIAGDNFGSVENPSNNSKGCGGVMRVAPVGLYLGGHSLDSAKAAYMGAQIAALTHGHPLGYIPAPHW